MDAVSAFARRVLIAAGVIAAAAAASGPLWAWGRPDRACGFALGAAASLLRFAWSVRLARRFDTMSPSRYGASRAATLAPLAAALFAAGAVEGIDLAATAVGVFLATAAAVVAALAETPEAPRREG